MKNINDGTQLGLTYSIGDQEDFNVSPNMCEWQDGIIGGKNMDAGAVITLSSQSTDGSNMGKPLSNPDYTITVAAPSTYTADQTIDVSLTLNDIPDGINYSMVDLFLYYDSSKVEPIYKNDGDVNNNMTAFLKKSPNNWESMCRLNEANGFYEIAFLTTNPDSLISTDGSFSLSVPFKVKATATGDILFQVPHAKTMCVDYKLNKHYGNGEKAVISSSNTNTIIPKSGSGLSIDTAKKHLCGTAGGLTANGLTNLFEGKVTIYNKKGAVADGSELIGTGFVVKNGTQQITVVLRGDGNGDGQVNSKDFLLAKRVFLGTYTLEGAELSALCIGGDSKPTALDYLKIKRHFLGTYNLYS